MTFLRQEMAGTSSWTTFEFPEDVLRGIHEKGFERPSLIQEKVLPLIQRGGHVVAQAKNGSGKTACFTLAMLCSVDRSNLMPQCFCIAPTRELATQNYNVTMELGKHAQITCFLCIAEGEKYIQSSGAQIVFATPGRLSNLISKRIMTGEFARCLVVDEADNTVLTESNMSGQVLTIHHGLNNPCLQVLLFSATFPDNVNKLVRHIAPNAQFVMLEKTDLNLPNVHQTFAVCPDDNSKKQMLTRLYESLVISQSIIFTNTRENAMGIAAFMTQSGHAVSLICGSAYMGQGQNTISAEDRDRVMTDFRTGASKVLVATDVISRGIDVQQVTMVINCNLPTNRTGIDLETYLHRIGRTGRFGERGLAINLVDPAEAGLMDQIRHAYGCTISEFDGDFEKLEGEVRRLRT